jgi:hypothetical protein
MLLKRYAVLTVALVLFGVPTRATAGPDFTATATLSGASELPPTATTATGFGTFHYLSALNELTYDVTFNNLTSNATIVRLHSAPATANGASVLPLLLTAPGTSGEISGTATDADIINGAATGVTTIAELAQLIQLGDVYLNIHSQAFPGGEIRGQLVVSSAVAEPTTASLVGAALIGFALRLRSRRESA